VIKKQMQNKAQMQHFTSHHRKKNRRSLSLMDRT